MSQMLPEMFEALGQDAGQAMEDAAEADARFLEKTANNGDTALQRIAEADQQIARQAAAVGEKASQDAQTADSTFGFSGRTSNDELTNVLRDWKSQRFQFGSEQFLLDRSDFGHILSRHMPELWDGSVKAEQTFFSPDLSTDDIMDAVRNVLGQNRDTLIRRGTNAIYQVEGSYGGVEYVLGVNNGHIAQFFPLSGG